MNRHKLVNEAPLVIHDTKDNAITVGEGQCDCACVAVTPINSLPSRIRISESNRYKLIESFQAYPLVEGYYTVLTQSTRPVVLNEAALAIANLFEQPQFINLLPMVTNSSWGEKTSVSCISDMIQLGLLVPESKTDFSLAEHSEILTSWLHITDRCNLNCTYCYLPHERKDMSALMGQKAIEATFRSAVEHRYQQVKLKYAGGEPLIRFSTIALLHTYAQRLAEKEQLLLDGVVLSNGTLLTDEIVKQMHSHGLRLMVSLDGLGRFHDQQRPFAGGHGSFANAVHGIDLALDLGLVPDISITVSGRNVKGLPEVVSWLLERELPFSLNFYRENELSSPFQDLIWEEQELITNMLSAFQMIEEKLPAHSLIGSIIDRANLATPHLRTCGVGHSYLVFDHAGRVSKCQMHQHNPITTVEADDPLSLVRNDQIGIQNISVEEKEDCSHCEWKYWCAGGCPLVTYRTTGRFDARSPNCHVYKALYPAAVRLEGLRLLKFYQTRV